MIAQGALHISRRKETTITCANSLRVFIKRDLVWTFLLKNSTVAVVERIKYLSSVRPVLLENVVLTETSVLAISVPNILALRSRTIK